MPANEPQTVGDLLYWCYANLAMMATVLENAASRPGRQHYSIRARLYAGLRSGTMNVRGYLDDEKLKLTLPRHCWYCGSKEQLSADHIVPQARGGCHGGENLVYACRRCNSSKGSKDLLEWMHQRGQFPPLYLLRRYLKMAIEHCRRHQLMDLSLANIDGVKDSLPFALHMIPRRFPEASRLCKWLDCEAAT